MVKFLFSWNALVCWCYGWKLEGPVFRMLLQKRFQTILTSFADDMYAVLKDFVIISSHTTQGQELENLQHVIITINQSYLCNLQGLRKYFIKHLFFYVTLIDKLKVFEFEKAQKKSEKATEMHDPISGSTVRNILNIAITDTYLASCFLLNSICFYINDTSFVFLILREKRKLLF